MTGKARQVGDDIGPDAAGRDEEAERSVPLGERPAFLAPALQADDRRSAVGHRRVVGDDLPVIVDEGSVFPEGHVDPSRLRV